MNTVCNIMVAYFVCISFHQQTNIVVDITMKKKNELSSNPTVAKNSFHGIYIDMIDGQFYETGKIRTMKNGSILFIKTCLFEFYFDEELCYMR